MLALVLWTRALSAGSIRIDREGPLRFVVPQYLQPAFAAVAVDAHYLGSDPAIVAAVIQHYLDRPGQRSLLGDGVEAIRAVELASPRRSE